MLFVVPGAFVRVFQAAQVARISYLRNAQGQRVFKGEPTAAQTLPSQADLGTDFITWLKKNFSWLYATAQANTSIGTAFVYGDSEIPNWALLGDYDNGSAKGAGRTEYVWLPTEDGSAIPVGLYRGGKFFAIHSDHLGTPRLMTTEANTPVWQWPYSAFGNNKPTGILKATPNPKAALTNKPILLKATAATEMNLRLPGQADDTETGTFYNYFRMYDPRIRAGYTQADPIGLDGGLNRFLYVENDPLNWIDPEGLQAEHTKNARPSTEQKHQEAEARRQRDAGGEKGDQRRRPPSKRPPGYKGPWPIIPGFIPLVCPLCDVVMPQPKPWEELC